MERSDGTPAPARQATFNTVVGKAKFGERGVVDTSSRCAGPVPKRRKQRIQRIQRHQQTGRCRAKRICVGKSDLPVRQGQQPSCSPSHLRT